MATFRKYGPYRIFSALDMTEAQLQKMVALFRRSAGKPDAALEGRSAIATGQLGAIGPVAIKYYARGGLIRHLVKKHYLKWGRTRCRLEFEMLQKVRQTGINAPEAIAHAHRGRLFYQAWLVTRAIDQPASLARLSLQDANKTGMAMESVVQQVAVLIQNEILHVDLHPGNVVVDSSGKVYLLDFDKSRIFRGGREKLKKRYIDRWQRAVRKHRLPEMLAERMQAGLKTFEF